MEEEKGEWGFKALKQMVKAYFRDGNFGEMMLKYKEMLQYIKSAVTRNYSEKSINGILDYVSSSQKLALLQEFYETTLEALRDAKNDRLWFKTNLKLGTLWFEGGEYGRLAKILKELHRSCQDESGEDDPKKGTQLLEIHSLEIQMHTETKNNKMLKEVYNRCLTIKSAIPHPRIMGVIRECGGKMYMTERDWDKAVVDFFEAFKNYDECGSPRRVHCLKYLVLASMLQQSEINPFDSQEAKPYKNDPEILAMTNLVAAYQNNEIQDFVHILRTNQKAIMGDPFIRFYIEDVTRNIRQQVLLQILQPYTRVRLDFLCRQLNMQDEPEEVEGLLVALIHDGKISGKIDQVNSIVLLDNGAAEVDARKFESIAKWQKNLAVVQRDIAVKIQ